MPIKITVLAFLALLCLGMAGTGGWGPELSESDRYFKAVIIDEFDNRYQVQNLSVNGSTHLKARTGAAEADIDFGRISRILFYLQDDEVLARLTFVGDDEMDFYIDPDMAFLGRTEWGRITLRAGDIKEISFKQ